MPTDTKTDSYSYGGITTTCYKQFAQICPVCNGRCKVKKGFYEGKDKLKSPLTDLCKACEGKGIIYNFFSIPYIPDIPDEKSYITPDLWIGDTLINPIFCSQ